ncbi:hypothetical protein BJ944DRAFT_180328 [Cunninghamella echinulata]|nr:hypothetical protein BJ944DRAFT_180328 [Cunninghamella echinulata]
MPDSQNYLKNLSQKKYAWIEEATAAAAAADITSTTPQKSADHTISPIKSNAELKNNTSIQTSEGSSKPYKKPRSNSNNSNSNSNETGTSIPSTLLTTEEVIENLNNKKKFHTPSSISQPNFKYTTFPIKGYTILPTRNITSTFVKSDTTFVKGHKSGDEAICPKAEEEWHDTIIIHPGSRNLRIGLASEAYPITVPHVIGRYIHKKNQENNNSSSNNNYNDNHSSTKEKEEKENHNMEIDNDSEHDDGPNSKNQQYYDALKEMKSELTWRMKNAKRRTLPNADHQVISFNSQAPMETILDHNDPYRVEWIDIKNEAIKEDVFVGDKALRLPINKNSDDGFRLFWPWKNGTLNHDDYTSIQAVLGDLQTIWTSVIHNELGVEDKSFENYNAVLVVPDLFKRSYISDLMTMMLQQMKFRGIFVQQSSSCATFGAGASSACVVDIGAQTTTIACVDEGVPIVDSRMAINVGGDDITRTFASFLIDNQFPYTDLNLSRHYDWRLIESLKEKWCTMNEAEISVQVYDFFVRAPYQHTYKYQCKVYDEVFLAPLCLVIPSILEDKQDDMHDHQDLDGFNRNGVIDDITEDSNTTQNVNTNSISVLSNSAVKSKTPSQVATPMNEGTETNAANETTPLISISSFINKNKKGSKNNKNYKYYPIDIAIAQSIQLAAGNSDDRLKRFFTNIILVGAGGKISNFDRVLEDRLLSTVIARSSMIENVEVLPAPRELDPQLLVWKGASVLCKLDVAKDMWIGEPEWNEIGSRLLKDRSMLF